MTGRAPDIRGDLAGPKSKPISIHGAHFIADGGNMEDQPKVFDRKVLRCRRWVNVEAWERENASSLPLLDGGLDLGSPHQIGLVGRSRSLIGNRHVVIRASDLMLGTVTTTKELTNCILILE